MAPGSTLSAEDDLKLCYALIKLAPGKTNWAAVAKFMDLKDGATKWRVNALMNRCKKMFGEIAEDGSALGVDDATTKATPKGKATSKRKRTKSDAIKDEVTPKDEEDEAAEDHESPTKRTKVEAPLTEVKVEEDIDENGDSEVNGE